MKEEKRNEQLISEDGSAALWTVVEAENEPDAVTVIHDDWHPEDDPKPEGPDEVIYPVYSPSKGSKTVKYSVKKEVYSSSEVEGFKKQLSSYYYKVLEMSIEVNDDMGIEEITSKSTHTEDIDIGDAIVRDGKLFGLFIDASKFDSSFNNQVLLFENDAAVKLQGTSYAEDVYGMPSSYRFDKCDYIITLKLRDNG